MPAPPLTGRSDLQTSLTAKTSPVSPVQTPAIISPAASPAASGLAFSSRSRRSEIHRDFLKAFSPSHTSAHPGGTKFTGECSSRALDAEGSYGAVSRERYQSKSSLNTDQVESKYRNSANFSFGKDVIPSDFGGRGAFAKMPSAYGTISVGMLNDDVHVRTRPHVYDTRAFGTCLGDQSASWEAESIHVEPPRVVFSKVERTINPRAWGR